ncbi:MAG: hypothetical protein KatS3mg110_3432 [Pirellulaceae bacterium]|nr:MAG: hypothetical protein KatS3mg110_3432 [Pirellulaceae bacterium]
MQVVVAVDEAGYGPRLGPLVIAATIWQTPDGESLALADQRARRLLDAGNHKEQRRLRLTDSKKAYRGHRRRWADLEYDVLGAWAYLQESPQSWRELWSKVATDEPDTWRDLPWYATYDRALPIEIDARQTAEAAAQWSWLARQADLHLIAIKLYALFPESWNQRLVVQNKAEILAESTLRLVRESLAVPEAASCPQGTVVCDHLGGRKYYAALIQQFLSASWVEIVSETALASHYRLGNTDGKIFQILFQVSADAQLSLVGFSSMVAKYVRELAMAAFNGYWQERIPGLRPTAGYPADAERFIQQVADQCRRLGVRAEQWIRQR